jgi:site-specific DNA recombinase
MERARILRIKEEGQRMKNEIKNCAIYCRKSSDEGLDMDFNTLDAQREACEAYITSQRSEGWKAVKTVYNDGGYSGGTMERPALQNLLNDIISGKVNIIVVYKIDRLTRSLMDFAKLVDVFDEYGVTFVSVTQSFNTTTSMGRLTLNVLLSFAQFEREVSAERIRDKIAASKQKGMWMGGNPPVGYEIKDRKLIVNEDEAKTALHLFERYKQIGCVSGLKRELDGNHILSRRRRTAKGNSVGGGRYSRGALYAILQNPIYIGKIRHKEKIYEGQHEAIIPEDLWNDVQEILKSGAGAERGTVKPKHENLLKGLLFDCDGTRYSPIRAKKGETKAYRYYISQNLLQFRDHPKGVMARLPAHELEQTIGKAVRKDVADILDLDPSEDYRVIDHIKGNLPEGDELVKSCVQKITVGQEILTIEISPEHLRDFLEEKLKLAIPSKPERPLYILPAPFSITRANKGAIIMSTKNSDHDPLDLPPHQLRNLVRGIVWRDEHFDGMSIEDIATREGLSKSGVRKIIMGSFDTLMAL